MKYQSFINVFEKTTHRKKSSKAITFLRNGQVETILTYFQLNKDSVDFAAILHGKGIKKGDRVILLLEKSLIAVTAHLAIQYLGAVSVPLNPGFKKDELQYLLNDANAGLIILSPEKETLISNIAPNLIQLSLSTKKPYQHIVDTFTDKYTQPKVFPSPYSDPNDPALIIYTSGTTGNPKGAILTQNNMILDAQNIISTWAMSETDRLCHALPLFHVHGLCFALHTSLLIGAQIVMLDRFSPNEILYQLSPKESATPCTVFMAVPAMYTKMLDAVTGSTHDLSHVRLATSGSAPLPSDTFHRIRDTFGIEPVEREGMSETGMNFSNPLNGQRKPGSIGLPLPGLKVRIVDPNTYQNVREGEIGEFWLKSPSISPGYWRKPQETQEAFENGWFKTGDLGRIDSDGYYYLTDRIKHIIITGGENVSPVEVEAVINQMDNVIESSVVGVADAKWGEKIVAAVVATPKSKPTDTQIISYCKTKLHDWKCPKEIAFFERLPRNTMGKVLKNEVKRHFMHKTENDRI